MDCQVGWTAKAYADVEQIAAYIAEDSPYYAQMVVEKIIDVSLTLDHFPERGRVAPDLEDTNVREVLSIPTGCYTKLRAIKSCFLASFTVHA